MHSRAKSLVGAIIDDNPYISVINKIEVPGFSVVNREILDFIDTAIVLGLTDSIVEKTINIRKTLRIKLPDAIIAATAIDKRMHSVTRNKTDFEHIKGLSILNPWDESNGEIFSP